MLLANARRLHSGVRWDLWHATDPADLKRRTALEELDRADEAIGQLSSRLKPEQRVEMCRQWFALEGIADPSYFAKSTHGTVGGIADDLRAILAAVVLPTRSVEAEERRARVIGTGVVLLAATLTIWGALVTSYFDKPFGTLRDYLTLLAWGLGTTAALDLINSTMTKVSAPLRTPKSPAAGAGAGATPS